MKRDFPSVLNVPQDGRMWVAHWTLPDIQETILWGDLKKLLTQSEIAQLDEGGADVKPHTESLGGNLRWLKGRKADVPHVQMDLDFRRSQRSRVSVLHWYTRYTGHLSVKAHVQWLIGKLGFRLAEDPIERGFPNPAGPDGHTVSFLLRDGVYDNMARHIILAESHIGVGAHLTFHTFPQPEGGVVFYTLVTWDHIGFLRIQNKLWRWGMLSGGIVEAAQYSIGAESNFYTLACCSQPKFECFLGLLRGDQDLEATIVRDPRSKAGEAIPLVPPWGLVRNLPFEEDMLQAA